MFSMCTGHSSHKLCGSFYLGSVHCWIVMWRSLYLGYFCVPPKTQDPFFLP
jgi:hypothetical protein